MCSPNFFTQLQEEGRRHEGGGRVEGVTDTRSRGGGEGVIGTRRWRGYRHRRRGKGGYLARLK